MFLMYTTLLIEKKRGSICICVETHKKILLDELCVLDGLEEERALHDKEKLRKVKVISNLERATLLEEEVEGSMVKRGLQMHEFFH